MSEKMIFCLGEGKYESEGEGYQKKLRIFNKDVSEEVYNKAKLDIKNFKLPITKWKDKYLKDAWKEYWSRATEEQKKFFMTLPNFEWSIFTSITGIENGVGSLIGQEVSVTIGDKTYKAKII